MFRPCIDIHNGQVKQIVGGSLKDAGSFAKENFVSELSAADYARMYQKDGLKGGHIILLNKARTEYFNATKSQAIKALSAYPLGLQIGGGITASNAKEYLDAGASHVIVTSYLFPDGELSEERLTKMKDAVGKDRLVIDLSCKKVGRDYYVATDRWQHITKSKLNLTLLNKLTPYCDEFLIHAVDVEGKRKGPAKGLISILAKYKRGNRITYAGGIHDLADVKMIEEVSEGKLDFTIGSALSLFGGDISYRELIPKRGGNAKGRAKK